MKKTAGEMAFNPAVDVDETPTGFNLMFDLPGVNKNEMKIELHDNRLMVTGERRKERKEAAKGQQYEERIHGTFARSFTFPTKVDSERVEAEYKDGVLKVFVPKVQAAQPRQVTVK
jgi:HSP20 family protein